jgi:hypothetical protein
MDSELGGKIRAVTCRAYGGARHHATSMFPNGTRDCSPECVSFHLWWKAHSQCR